GHGPALERAEQRAVEGQGGLEQQSDTVAPGDAEAVEQVREPRRPRGEVPERPLLATAVGELQVQRRAALDPAIDALVAEVEVRAVAVDEIPQRRPLERLDHLGIAARDTAHEGDLATARWRRVEFRRQPRRIVP